MKQNIIFVIIIAIAIVIASGYFLYAKRQAGFNEPIVMQINDEVVFPDGVSLTLKEINDSRCKPGVQCIWQGELSSLFSIDIKGSLEEIRLGTVNNKKVSLGGYEFSLEDATEISATVIVSVNLEIR